MQQSGTVAALLIFQCLTLGFDSLYGKGLTLRIFLNLPLCRFVCVAFDIHPRRALRLTWRVDLRRAVRCVVWCVLRCAIQRVLRRAMRRVLRRVFGHISRRNLTAAVAVPLRFFLRCALRRAQVGAAQRQFIHRHLFVLGAQLTRWRAVKVKALRGLCQGHQITVAAGVPAQHHRQQRLGEQARRTRLNVGLNAQLQRLGHTGEQSREKLFELR